MCVWNGEQGNLLHLILYNNLLYWPAAFESHTNTRNHSLIEAMCIQAKYGPKLPTYSNKKPNNKTIKAYMKMFI